MIVTNQTSQDIYFGPLHLGAGIGTTLTVDDTSATSLYLTNDTVADALNNAYLAGKITVSSQAQPFPRPTGVPQLLHGDGSPEGLVFAPQGSVYLRRDGTGANSLYTKTTGMTQATGWQNYTTTATAPGTTYRKTTPRAVNNTTTETDLLNGEITIGAGVMSATAMLRLTAWGDVLNDNAFSAPPRFKLKLGGTVIFDSGATGGWGPSTIRLGWRIAVEILNAGAQNSQVATVQLMDGMAHSSNGYNGRFNGAWSTGEGAFVSTVSSTTEDGLNVGNAFNTGSVDMSVAETLQLTVINAVASTSYETKLYGALVETI